MPRDWLWLTKDEVLISHEGPTSAHGARPGFARGRIRPLG